MDILGILLLLFQYLGSLLRLIMMVLVIIACIKYIRKK